jgi:hypothetical protein
MSIFGTILKGSVTLAADGLDFVINKTTDRLGNKYEKQEVMKTVAEIGSGAVRGTESTVKILADVVDGGLETGAGYLLKDRSKQDVGVNRMKSAGMELATGFGKGLVCTYDAGSKTTASSYKAARYYVKGSRCQAGEEFARTKAHARDLGKIVAVGLLSVGPVNIDDPEKKEAEQ